MINKWIQSFSPSIYDMGERMGYSDRQITQFQVKRIGFTFGLFFLGIGLVQYLGMYSLGLFFVLGILFWLDKRQRLVKQYKQFSLVRQVSFSQFCRMLIPYLLMDNQGKSLYTIFSHLAKRMEGTSIHHPLCQLLVDMTDKPNDIAPFIAFAKAGSRTDEAINFMTTLFYYQQSSDDPTTIHELGRLANDELFEGVQEIVDVKTQRLGKYPLFITFAIAIPMVGILGSFIVEVVRGVMT